MHSRTPPRGLQTLARGGAIDATLSAAGGLSEVRLTLPREAPDSPASHVPQHLQGSQLCIGAPTGVSQDQRPCAVGRGAGGTRAWTPLRANSFLQAPQVLWGDGVGVPTNVCIVPCSETGLPATLPPPGAHTREPGPACFPSSGLKAGHTLLLGLRSLQRGLPWASLFLGKLASQVDRC